MKKLWQQSLGVALERKPYFPVIAGGWYWLPTGDDPIISMNFARPEGGCRKHDLPGNATTTSLATDGRSVFISVQDVNSISPSAKVKDVIALDGQTGREIWRVPTDGTSLSPVTISSGIAYCTSNKGSLYAIEIDQGHIAWRIDVPTWGPIAPAVGNGVICVGGSSNTLYLYDVNSGEAREQFTAGDEYAWFNTIPPAIGDGIILAVAGDGVLYALDLHGKQLWKQDPLRGAGPTTRPVISNGRVFVATRVDPQDYQSGHAVLALDLQQNTTVWGHATERPVLAPPLAVDGVLFFGSTDGRFYALRADNGNRLDDCSVPKRLLTRPVVDGDIVVICAQDGTLHAFDWSQEREAVMAKISPVEFRSGIGQIARSAPTLPTKQTDMVGRAELERQISVLEERHPGGLPLDEMLSAVTELINSASRQQQMGGQQVPVDELVELLNKLQPNTTININIDQSQHESGVKIIRGATWIGRPAGPDTIASQPEPPKPKIQCPHCGRLTKEGGQFCERCGKSLS
ncbi:MAG: PQQ-binding-like beta-propeller repeat protein [Anaerolineae bacterium]|nr:PQQ-binding-like beta-propeller repeat protein [Anaerolineae bacterium]